MVPQRGRRAGVQGGPGNVLLRALLVLGPAAPSVRGAYSTCVCANATGKTGCATPTGFCYTEPGACTDGQFRTASLPPWRCY